MGIVWIQDRHDGLAISANGRQARDLSMQSVKFMTTIKITDGGGWPFAGRNPETKWVIFTRHTGSVGNNYPHAGVPVAEEADGI
jgi:hypothetical protein